MQDVPYKTQPNTVNHLFYFYVSKTTRMSQCVITADTENVLPRSLFKEQWTPFHF